MLFYTTPCRRLSAWACHPARSAPHQAALSRGRRRIAMDHAADDNHAGWQVGVEHTNQRVAFNQLPVGYLDASGAGRGLWRMR